MATCSLGYQRVLPFVVVLTFSSVGDSISGDPIPQTDPASQSEEVLPAPDWIGIYDLRDKVGLRWISNPRFTAVRIYRRREVQDRGFELLAEIRNNSFFDTEVVSGQTYVYHLVAVGPGGEAGRPSSEKSITVVFAERPPPTPPAWEGYIFLEEGIGLKWSDLPDLEVLLYNVYRRTPEEPAFELLTSTAATSYNDRDVRPQQIYIYVLTTLDSSFKESSFSREMTVRYLIPRVAKKPEPERGWRTRGTRLVKILTKGEGDFFRPVDVALGPVGGKVFMTDSGTNKVQVFNSEGRFLRAYGSPGRGLMRFRRLLGAAVDGDGYLYFIDAGENAVVVVNPDGSARNRIVMTKYFNDPKMGLIDVVSGHDGRLLVVDNYNNRVSILRGGELVRSFGRAGFQGGEFNAPTFGSLDADGFFYLSDTLNGRVQVFDIEGNFVRAFGAYSQSPGGMARPKGVAVSARGEIYVADSWLNVIQVFDREGRFLAVLTDEKEQLLDLGSPNGIALDGNNRIYIAERLSGRLQIREILDAE